MRWFQLRPVFVVPLLDQRQQVIDKLAAEFSLDRRGKLFLMFGEYGELHLPASEHRLWSPHLSFYVAQQEETSVIRGRFAPRLEVWTFVWVLYLSFSFTAFFGFALAYSQWMLGESYWGLWVGLSAILGVFTLYAIANIGQQLSDDQMQLLRQQLDEILADSSVKVAPTTTVLAQTH